jgi:plastocyanin
MLKRTLLVVASVPLLAWGGYALAASLTVSLTEAGPQPTLATVAWGDTVTFSNGDSRPHRVTIPRVAVETPEIPPGGTFEYVFNGRGGNFGYRQMGGGPNRPGTIVVELRGTVTLTATPAIVPWGKTLRLAGRSSFPGTPVNLAVYRAPGGTADWTQVETVNAAADGSFAFVLKPERGARYRAQAAADQVRSAPVLVSMQPILSARSAARRTKTAKNVTISARVTPAGAATNLDLERFDSGRRRWVTEMRGRVNKAGRATFAWKAREGTSRLRVAAMPRSLADGWAPATSPNVVVVGVGKEPGRDRPSRRRG